MDGQTPRARFRGVGDLRLMGRQIYYEQLNFWLNPIGAVFTVGFSVVFLVLVGSTAGHQRSSAIGGGLLIGYNVPFPHNLPALVVVLVVGAASFTALGLGVSTLIPNQEAGAPVTSIVFFVLLFLS